MTPELKAKELVDKFRTYISMWSGGIEVENENLKQCALITVKEIAKNLDMNASKTFTDLQYWVDVKDEINKL